MNKNITTDKSSQGILGSWRSGPRITWPAAFLIAIIAATFVSYRFINIYKERFGKLDNIVSVKGIGKRIVDADEACVKISIKQCGRDVGIMVGRLHKSYHDLVNVLEKSGVGSDAIVNVSDNHRDLHMELINNYDKGFSMGHSPAITTVASRYRAACIKSLMSLVPYNEITQTVTIRTKKVKEAEKIGYYVSEFARNNSDLRIAISTSYVLYPETRQRLRDELLCQAVSDSRERAEMIAKHTKAKVRSTVSTDIVCFNIEPYGTKSKMVPYETKHGVFMYEPPESEVRFKDVYLVVNSRFSIR